AQVAAELAEGVAHVGHGADLVVGQAVDDHGDAAGGIALVADLLVVHALELAGRLLDGALDDVLGHVRRQRPVDAAAQPRVAPGIPTAGARGHRDLADQLGEDLPATRILRVLAGLDGRTPAHACYLVWTATA